MLEAPAINGRTARSASTPGSRGDDHFDLTSARILVVDDSVLDRELIEVCLRGEGYGNIAVAENGQQALDLVDAQMPDIVILDLEMPVLDGFATCAALRGNPVSAQVPILIQSGHGETEHIRRAFDAGANDMVGKPLKRIELLSRVRVHLQNRFLIKELMSYRQRVEQELDDARSMQRMTCPSDSDVARVAGQFGLDVGFCFEPSSELGGDLWGVAPVDDDRVCFYLADFAGHGVAAALNTFRLHTLLHRSEAITPDPAQSLAVLNEELCDTLRPGQYATMIWACIDRRRDTLTYSVAGSPPPLLVAADAPNRPRLGEGTGIPLGFMHGTTYDAHEVAFPPGSRMLLYSDALTEAENAAGEALGEAGLLEVAAREVGGLSRPDALAQMLEIVRGDFAMTVADDLTAVYIEASPVIPRRDGGPR